MLDVKYFNNQLYFELKLVTERMEGHLNKEMLTILEKCLKIVKQENFDQYIYIKKEVSRLIRYLYDGGAFENVEVSMNILDNIYIQINSIISMNEESKNTL